MEFKITKEKILEASSKCPQAKQTLEIMFPEAFAEEVVHKAGNRYKTNCGEEYLLARAGATREDQCVALVNLSTGNRYSDIVNMKKRDGIWCDALTKQEWDAVSNRNTFTKIN
jgi:hypothetical protein